MLTLTQAFRKCAKDRKLCMRPSVMKGTGDPRAMVVREGVLVDAETKAAIKITAALAGVLDDWEVLSLDDLEAQYREFRSGK